MIQRLREAFTVAFRIISPPLVLFVIVLLLLQLQLLCAIYVRLLLLISYTVMV